MSRVGKQIIDIPNGTTVTLEKGTVVVKGAKGELSRSFRPDVRVVVTPEGVSFEKKKDTLFAKAYWGTVASHVKNMIVGVNTPYTKVLQVEGVGFKSSVSGKILTLALGFSHDVKVEIPDGLTVTAEKNVITIIGIDKELVGLFAAKVRALKKPEPYKGKGIRYEGEYIRRKQGKKTV